MKSYNPSALDKLSAQSGEDARKACEAFRATQERERREYLAKLKVYDKSVSDFAIALGEFEGALKDAQIKAVEWKEKEKRIKSLNFGLPVLQGGLPAKSVVLDQICPFFVLIASLKINPKETLLRTRTREAERRLGELRSSREWRKQRGALARSAVWLALGQSRPGYLWDLYEEAYRKYSELAQELRGLITVPFLVCDPAELVAHIRAGVCAHILGVIAPVKELLEDRHRIPSSWPCMGGLNAFIEKLQHETCSKWGPPPERDLKRLPDSMVRAVSHPVVPFISKKDALELGNSNALDRPGKEILRPEVPFLPKKDAFRFDLRLASDPTQYGASWPFEDVLAALLGYVGSYLADREGIERDLPFRLTPSQAGLQKAQVGPPQEPSGPPLEPVSKPHWNFSEGGWEDWSWESHYEFFGLGEGPTPGRRILIGYQPHDGTPAWLDRKLLRGHAHILGRTGGGKTSAGLTPLTIQLIRGTDETDPDAPDYGKPAPMIVLDMKGDMALFHTVRMEAARRGQTFRYFTTHSGRDSFEFDPLQDLDFALPTPNELGDAILQALSLIHADEYGASFFTAAHVATMLKAIARLKRAGKAISWGNLRSEVERLDDRSSKRDLDHVRYALEPFLHEPLRSRAAHMRSLEDPRVISMPGLIDRREIAYFCLPIHRGEAMNRQLGKLAVLDFVHSAKARQDRGEPRRCYCIIDEFQELMARNIAHVFQTASGGSVSLIVANQSLSDLKSGREDLRGTVIGNTAFKQWFSMEHMEDQEYLRERSGEKLDWIDNHGRSEHYAVSESEMRGEFSGRSTASSSYRSHASAEQWGQSLQSSWFNSNIYSNHSGRYPSETVGVTFGVGGGSGQTTGGSSGTTNGHGDTSGEQWGESTARGQGRVKGTGTSVNTVGQWRPRVTNEVLQLVFAQPLGSMVLSSVAQANLPNYPVAVQALYAMPEREYKERSEGLWPPLATADTPAASIPLSLPAPGPRPDLALPGQPRDEEEFPRRVSARDPAIRKELRHKHQAAIAELFGQKLSKVKEDRSEDGTDPKR